MAQHGPSVPTTAGSTEQIDVLGASFRSILPTLNAILATLLEQSTSDHPPGSLEASSQVADKVGLGQTAVFSAHPQARELAGALEEMRKAAMELPGGGMSLEHIRRVAEALDREADHRR